MTGRIKRLLHSLLVPGSLRARAEQRWCHVDPHPSGSYNFQFLRSRVEGDFVRHPDLLWSPNPYWTSRAGLNGHVREIADRLGGSVWSDALLVLHPDDRKRTRASMLESWDRAAEAELRDCFDRLVKTQGLALAAGDRRFCVRVLADGDPVLGGTLGLEPGQFATAMLPNLYLGPQRTSEPLFEVFAAVGGAARFASVGTFFSDQLAFTIGAHELDNHTVPGLPDSALYTVHRFPGERGLRHKLGGAAAGRLALRNGTAHGGETVRVVDADADETLLEVMVVPTTSSSVAAVSDGQTILPDGFDLTAMGAYSIIPDELPARVHTLTERGFLLQRIHFAGVMRGYTMEIDRSGAVAPVAPDPVARVEVRGERVLLEAVTREVSLDGRPLRPGQSVALGGAKHVIAWRGGESAFESFRMNDKRWPYLGRLTTPGRTTPVTEGEVWTIGRDAEVCDVPLPDRVTTDNILWKSGAGDADHVEVRGGQVPRTRFRTDAILVATTAAEVDLGADPPQLRNPSTTCPLYVVRASGKAVRVGKQSSVALEPGDELLVGNCAFALAPPTEAEERDLRELPEVTELRLPTDQLPSLSLDLSLDPTILDQPDSWLLGGTGADPLGIAMTVQVDEAAAARPSRTALPKGLAIPATPVVDTEAGARLAKKSARGPLPSFGPSPRLEAVAAPSLGD